MDLGFSHSKVYEARSRSPGKKYTPALPPPMVTRSTAPGTTFMDRSRSPPRRSYVGNGSPLRSSYKA